MKNFREELNFQKRLKRIVSRAKIGVKEIKKDVLNKFELMNSQEIRKTNFFEFSLEENIIYVFTIKSDPYLRKELQDFKFNSPEEATIVFSKLYNKLKTDGCRFKDVSQTNFKDLINH